MTKASTHFGLDQFTWFIGVVEDREDPLNLGRVRVRIFNVHSQNENDTPRSTLPWAQLMMPVTSASLNGIGMSPTGIMVGSTVIGFFADGREMQIPIIMGTIHGIKDHKEENHDVAKLARGTNTIARDRVGPEPSSPYRSKYPYNKTITTESGHVVELDDTPGAERVNVTHKDGSYVELHPKGTTVIKTKGSRYDITVEDDVVYVGGNSKINVKGNLEYTVKGNLSFNVGGKIKFKGARIDFN